jgi:vacuolar protein sorting-associated protein 26
MLARLFGGPPAAAPAISVSFTPRPDNEQFRLPYFFPGAEIYLNSQPILGTVTIDPGAGAAVAHAGVRATLVGQIRAKADGFLEPFHSSATALAGPGRIAARTEVPFRLAGELLPAPSYYGTAYDVRWLVVFECVGAGAGARAECPIYVLFVDPLPAAGNPPRALPWAIGGLLRCDVCLDQSDLDVGACLLGALCFDLVRVRISRVLLAVERVESFDNGIMSSRLRSLVAEFEILDGEPVHGDRVPLRVFLPGIKLWPGPPGRLHLAVRYLIQLVAVGEDGERYESVLPCPLRRYVK